MSENTRSASKIEEIKTLLPYLSRYKKKLILGLIFIVLTNFVGALQPMMIKQAVDHIEQHADLTTLAWYGVLILGIALIEGIFLYFMRQTLIVVSRYIEYELRNDFFRHLQRMSMRFFHEHPTGDLMARATNDLNSVRALVGPALMYFCNTALLLFWTIGVMLLMAPALTFWALLPLPFTAFLVYKLINRIHSIYRRVQEKYSEITTLTQENISGIRVVKAYIQENLEKERFARLNQDYIKENLSMAKIRGLMWASTGLLSGIGALLVLWKGGDYVAGAGLSIGTLTAFFTLQTRLAWPMVSLGWVLNMTEQGIVSLKRINEILHTPPEITDSPTVRREITRLKGEIEFRDVSFAYNGTPILRNISFKLQPGKTMAIVGHTGAGKSTLLNLIPRLLDIREGEIFIDGIPIREIPLEVLRRNIGYVPQETFLFSDTIRENILFGVEHSENGEIEQVARVAQIYEDISEFENGFETMLGERGINLSGGQKQRTAISRAIIRKPAILLLDDALSAVDTYTEEEILKRLRREMAGMTSIIVSHRISTVKDADKIIVLENGEIRERGTHGSLLELNGIYAELHRKQLLEESLEEL